MNSEYPENKNYFYLGIDSRYALVNVSDRRVWLLLDDLVLAHTLRKLFWSKLALAVFDVQNCTNKHEIQLDNLCCLHWQIPSNIIRETGLFGIIIDGTFKHDYVLQSALEENHDLGKTILDRPRMLDIQYQMMLAAKLLPYCQTHTASDIGKIFTTNIFLLDIQQQLIEYAWQHLSSEKILSAQIISNLGALYD